MKYGDIIYYKIFFGVIGVLVAVGAIITAPILLIPAGIIAWFRFKKRMKS